MTISAKSKKGLGSVLKELQEYKEGHGCMDCLGNFPHYILEFDHRPECVKIDIVYRVLRNYGPEAAWKEVLKCDVVCANCHKERTHIREMVEHDYQNRKTA
jgi:hypothetical protein